MRKRGRAVGVVVGGALPAACSVAVVPSDLSGGAPRDAGGSDAASGDASDASDGDAPGDADGATCLDIANTGPSIPVTVQSGGAPAETGGAVSDGLYRATHVDLYGIPIMVMATLSSTLKIEGTTLEDISDALVQGAPMHTEVRGIYMLVGTAIDLTESCPAPGM